MYDQINENDAKNFTTAAYKQQYIYMLSSIHIIFLGRLPIIDLFARPPAIRSYVRTKNYKEPWRQSVQMLRKVTTGSVGPPIDAHPYL